MTHPNSAQGRSVSARTQLRLVGRESRAALSSELREIFSERMSRHFRSLFDTLDRSMRPSSLALYKPLPTEVDVGKIALWISTFDIEVVYPHVVAPEAPLLFGPDAGCPPKRGRATALNENMWILVPGLRFDDHGNRLGFGAGFYDRTLASSRARRIGVFFEVQRCARLPLFEHDVPMDAELTEQGFRWLSQPAKVVSRQ